MKRIFLIGMAGISLALGMIALIGCDQDGGGGGSGSEIVRYTSGSYTLVISGSVSANALELSANIYGSETAYSISDMKADVAYNYKLSDSSGATISSGTVTKSGSTLQFQAKAGQPFSANVSGTSLTFTSTITKDDGGTVSIGAFTETTKTAEQPGNDDFTKVSNEQVYQLSNNTIAGAYNGSGTVKIGDLTVGSVTGGKLTYTLPATVDAKYLNSIPEGFSSDFTVSSPNVRTLAVTAELYAGNTSIGAITLVKIAGNTYHMVDNWYFDRACSVTGSREGMIYSINASAGWNKVYMYGSGSSVTYTTNLSNAPTDLKWVFGSDNNDNDPVPGVDTSLSGTTWEVAVPASATGGQSEYTMRLTFTATTVTQVVIEPGDRTFSQGPVPYTLSGNTITVEGDVWTISGNTISIPNGGTAGETLTLTKVQ